ncbi:cytochrome c oxidase assembly protein [Sporosarcina sp. FA9]|uniref:cytochrome c oxidase assembly protein n=1 Tax=Sporosarcina sp. FA9 TaxID=3413030 RepID=UPI003F65BA74
MHHEAFFQITATDLLFGISAVVALISYLGAVLRNNRSSRLRKWSNHKTFFWILGVFIASTAVVGPLAKISHDNFTYHMIGHLLLGMLGPLLMALGAPVTLLLRSLNVRAARKVSKILKNRLVSFFTQPIVTSVLNIGGLWVLYTTDLFVEMHDNLLLYVLVHIHVFAAGYLFTISILYTDPVSRRYGYVYRTVVFIITLAGHGILSKYIYAYPPEGVVLEQARAGAMLMYYGGDTVDLVLIFILFHHWYRSHHRRFSSEISPANAK